MTPLHQLAIPVALALIALAVWLKPGKINNVSTCQYLLKKKREKT